MNRITPFMLLAAALCSLAACSDPLAPHQSAPEVSVTSVAPRTGVPGTRVAIQGRGFGSNPASIRILLGGRRLTIVSLQDDQVVVEIPPGALSGQLVVRVCGRSVHTAGAFTITPERGRL